MSIIIESQNKIQYDNYIALNTKLIIDNEIINLTLQVTNEYGKYLTNEIGDHILYLLLPMALVNNLNIISKIPMTEHFLHNIKDIYIPSITLGTPKLFNINIDCDTTNTFYKPFAVGTAITCGIDSIYTTITHKTGPFHLTHLFICNSSVDLGYQNKYNVTNWDESNPFYFDRANKISKELNLPIVKIYSNYLKFLCYHPKGINHLFSHHFISLSHILALKKMIKMYYFSGECGYINFSLENAFFMHTSNQELLCNLTLCHDTFFCHNTGIDVRNRIEKTVKLMSIDDPLKQYLHPCFKKTEKNCSKPTCKKCLHMLCTLDYYDMLNTAIGIYDIDKYKTQKEKYLKKLIEMKDLEFLNPVYKLMLKKYPKEMKQLIV